MADGFALQFRIPYHIRKIRIMATNNAQENAIVIPTPTAEVVASRMLAADYSRAVARLVSAGSRHDFVFVKADMKNAEFYLDMSFRANAQGKVPTLVEKDGKVEVRYISADLATANTPLVVTVTVETYVKASVQDTIGWSARTRIEKNRAITFMVARDSKNEIRVFKADKDGIVQAVKIPKRLQAVSVDSEDLSRMVALKFDAFFHRAKDKVENLDGREVKRENSPSLAMEWKIQRENDKLEQAALDAANERALEPELADKGKTPKATK
jgi:hypothetical protein